MAYEFLKDYRWSPNHIKIITYEKGSVHEDLPEKLIEACEKENYPLLKIINKKENEMEKIDVASKDSIKTEHIELKIEEMPENKMEPAPERKRFKRKRKK